MSQYPKDNPPDLYIFTSWHFRRSYREAHIADEVWSALREVASVAELKQHMDAPSKIDVPIHAKVREIFRLPKYEDHSPFWEPAPQFVGDTLSDFLKFYFKSHPDAIQSEKNTRTSDSKPDASETNHSQKDADSATNEFDQEDSGINASPPALKGDLETKRKPGRPKKQVA